MRDKLERTPLHCAAISGFINCMNLLLENGANVDVQDQAVWFRPFHRSDIWCLTRALPVSGPLGFALGGAVRQFRRNQIAVSTLCVSESHGVHRGASHATRLRLAKRKRRRHALSYRARYVLLSQVLSL